MNGNGLTQPCAKPAPAIPGDYELLKPWFNLIRHARAEFPGGPAAIVLRVIVDEHGNPITNGTPHYTRLAPKATAEEIIDELVRALVEQS